MCFLFDRVVEVDRVVEALPVSFWGGGSVGYLFFGGFFFFFVFVFVFFGRSVFGEGVQWSFLAVSFSFLFFFFGLESKEKRWEKKKKGKLITNWKLERNQRFRRKTKRGKQREENKEEPKREKRKLEHSIAQQTRKEKEERELRELFDKFDRGKDGNLDKEELRSAIIHLTKLPCSNEDLERVMELVDIDGNHLVDFEEFARLVRFLKKRRKKRCNIFKRN